MVEPIQDGKQPFDRLALGAAVLDKNAKSVASGRTMDAIASGKGRRPKPFMLSEALVEADAVWDRSQGLAAEERKAGRHIKPRASKKTKPAKRASFDMPDFIEPQLCETLDCPPSDCIIDGEICALDENGAPDFAALQAALSEGTTDDLVYFAFSDAGGDRGSQEDNKLLIGKLRR